MHYIYDSFFCFQHVDHPYDMRKDKPKPKTGKPKPKKLSMER